MRPVIVVTLNEVIKTVLLLQEVVAGWTGGLLLEGQVHAFVTVVLLWMARLDAFNRDTEPQPPDGEPAQAEQGMRGGERHAVVGTWRSRQIKLLEGTFKDREGPRFLSWIPALRRPAGSVSGNR